MVAPTIIRSVDIYSGDSCFFPSLTFKTNNVPVDLSSWTFTAQWRSSREDATAMALNVDASGSATGVIVVSATPEQTAAMGGRGVWDLQGIRGSEVRTFVTGATTYSRDVTRG